MCARLDRVQGLSDKNLCGTTDATGNEFIDRRLGIFVHFHEVYQDSNLGELAGKDKEGAAATLRDIVGGQDKRDRVKCCNLSHDVKIPIRYQFITRRTSNCQIGQKVGLLSHDVSTANLPVKPKSVTN